MTEKIAWLEEVLRLEPNSKLFFTLARAYARDQRPEDAIAVLRKGLTFHPEHLEARLLLIECLSELDAGSKDAPFSAEATPKVEILSSPELESLTTALAGHPAFWRQWAASSRAEGRTDLAVTLDMLAVQLGGARISWGTLLEQGLRAVTGGRDEPPSPTPLEEQAPTSPVSGPLSALELEPEPEHEPEHEPETDTDPKPAPGPDLTPDPGQESELESGTPSPDAVKEPPEVEAIREEESLDVKAPEGTEPSRGGADEVSGRDIAEVHGDAPETLEQTTQAPPVRPVEPEAFEAPSPEAEVETPLSEGERRYYETKTYADLLAKQGEHEEALDLYAKLLQTSPDDEQRLDLEARIQELRDRVAKGIKEPITEPVDLKDTKPLPEPEPGPEPEPKQEPETELSIEKQDAPRDVEDSAASSPTSPSPKTATTRQTLKKLAERLESRAGK